MAVYAWAARAIIAFGPNAPHAATAVAILNALDVISGLNKIAGLIGGAARQHDEGVGAEIVELARSRAPVDTGRLAQAITARRVEDQIEIVVDAAREVAGAEFYAWFVERGTRRAAARRFFWNSAHEVFERQGRVLQAEFDSIADEFNRG